jgi:hypothetical protein
VLPVESTLSADSVDAPMLSTEPFMLELNRLALLLLLPALPKLTFCTACVSRWRCWCL